MEILSLGAGKGDCKVAVTLALSKFGKGGQLPAALPFSIELAMDREKEAQSFVLAAKLFQ
jgi:hypothetical protein